MKMSRVRFVVEAPISGDDMPNSTTIMYVYVCDDYVGEVEGMFYPNGDLLDLWSNNDATWRNEYFRGFMSQLGITVEEVWSDEWQNRLVEAAKEHWGL